MNFNTKKRLLTKNEKLRRAIFYYGDIQNIELKFAEEMFDEYGQPNVLIEENINQFPESIKKEIFDFADREIYDETIDMKCTNCDYEELNQDYEEITYGWNQINYPICYCPNCGKGTFVPLDIYNKKKH